MNRIAASLFALCLLALSSPAQAQLACPYPFMSGAPCTAVTASATGTIAATVATLPAVAGKTTYICSLSIAASATAAASVPATVTGTVSGSLNYNQPVTAISAVGVPLIVSFSPCVPASASNTPIAVNAGAAGTGGVTAVTTTGYQL
jgi:hypothetical protein